MDNPKETGNIGHTRRKQAKQITQKTKKDEQHGPHQKIGLNPDAREV